MLKILQFDCRPKPLVLLVFCLRRMSPFVLLIDPLREQELRRYKHNYVLVGRPTVKSIIIDLILNNEPSM